ncbi:MAG: DUF3047 domain-containing protein [Candidatus Binatia bacterium]
MSQARMAAAAIAALPATVREPHVAEMRLITLAGHVPPWNATDVQVRRGEWMTLLASGRLVLAEALDLWLPPSLALWGRIGGRGPIFNGTRDTTSVVAEHDGLLELALYNGEWATPDGTLATAVEAYAGSSGTIDVVVIRWHGNPERGLAALAAALPEDELIDGERDRLARAVASPPGWKHLWFLGPTECFHAHAEDGHAAIRIDTTNDVGILQTAVEFPLGPATTLEWRWCVDELPAVGGEDTPLAHDYMSLALEFENGQDLTWYWSAALPVGSHYSCPLPTWAARETHWVVRSGSDGLGRWHDERRRVADDYRAAVGAVPSRIVGVWLIAVSVFGHRRGRAAFADVILRDGDRELRVI